MIRSLGDKIPEVSATAWVSEFAYVVGNVEIGEHSSIWPGVTIRGDGVEKIVIGSYVNVQENSVIHGGSMVIEDYVTIGHSVVVHGNRIGEGSLLGNNCTVLDRSSVGKYCLIAANSVVLSLSEIPDYSFVTGVPGTIKREVSPDRRERMQRAAHHHAERAKLYRDSGL